MRERHLSVAFHTHPDQGPKRNLGTCPSGYRRTPQPTLPHQPGPECFFKLNWFVGQKLIVGLQGENISLTAQLYKKLDSGFHTGPHLRHLHDVAHRSCEVERVSQTITKCMKYLSTLSRRKYFNILGICIYSQKGRGKNF